MHSLRTKIAMLAVWVTVIAVAVATLLSVVFIRNAEHSQSEQLLLLLCETGERNLDYYFNSVEKSLRKVAAYTEKDLDGLETEKFQRHMERVEKYFEEIANKTNGVLTYYYRIDPSVSETVKGFWYTNLEGKDFTEHEVTDISQYDTEDTNSLVWFTVPKQTGNPIWLPPYITDNLDVRVISYNIPITYRGRFIGVIGIEIDYSVMADQVESIRLYNNGYAFLTDANGTLIFHPRIDLAQMSEEEKPKIPEGLLSESTFTSYTFSDTKKEAVWLSLSNGMRLYVSVPESETDGDWHLLIRSVLIAAAAVLFLSILLTRFITGRITKPLKQLTEAAQQADQGYYDVSLDYNGKDIGLVSAPCFRGIIRESVHRPAAGDRQHALVVQGPVQRAQGAGIRFRPCRISEAQQHPHTKHQGEDFFKRLLHVALSFYHQTSGRFYYFSLIIPAIQSESRRTHAALHRIFGAGQKENTGVSCCRPLSVTS